MSKQQTTIITSFVSGPNVLCLVLGKGASIASDVKGSRYKEDSCFIESRGSLPDAFLGKGREFKDTF